MPEQKGCDEPVPANAQKALLAAWKLQMQFWYYLFSVAESQANIQ